MLRRFVALVGLVAAMTLLTATAAQAEVTVNESIPLVGLTVFIPCANDGAGEFVSLDGELHVLLTFSVNGNNVSSKFHFQPQGVSGLGLVTGDKYQGTGVTQGQSKGSLQNGQFTTTSVNNFRIIGQGPGNNYLLHESFHITFNATGDVTVVHDNFSIDCK